MRVKNDYIPRKIADEYLLIPVGEAAMTNGGLIALTESGFMLFEKLQQDCTDGDLLKAILDEYDVSSEVAKTDLDAFLDQMRQLNMLVEDK